MALGRFNQGRFDRSALRRKEESLRLRLAIEDYRERTHRNDPRIRKDPKDGHAKCMAIGEPDATPFRQSSASGWPTLHPDPDRRALVDQWLESRAQAAAA